MNDIPLEIYKAYPRKVNRVYAMRCLNTALKMSGDDPQDVLNRTREYARYVKTQDVPKKYIPHPSTWFNNWGWQEDYEDRHPQQHANDNQPPEINRQIRLL